MKLVQCPHCAHRMTLRDPKPGQYQPKCSKCGASFRLSVPNDGGEPTVASVSAERPVDRARAPSGASVSPPAPSQTAAGAGDATTGWEANERPHETAPPLSAATTAEFAGAAATLAPTSETSKGAATPAGNGDDQFASDPSATAVYGHATHTGGIDATLEPASSPRAPATDAAGITARPAATVAVTGTVPLARSEALPERLGGYRLVRELGRGAMGAVYLARQVSLDRNVALKTVQTQWSDHPQVMARFTREAYAAAQLTHHNVVQIYDLGNDHGIPYFSMEYVEGQSLAEVLHQHQKLDPRTAAGYALQAARGLRFAHRHGMVHRDVKPANLMLNDQGVVKVADLGLVKTPELLDLDEDDGVQPSERSSLAAATANVTLMNSAMGTPAYMAPEQVENAAGVDHRADIYSLGCTLYALLTGRPPFDGATALEVITKQKTQPVPRIETVEGGLPPELAAIVMRMVAKSPDERFHDLDQVIEHLESFLGIGGAARLPNEDHVRELEAAVSQFNAAPAARLRRLAALGLLGASGVLALVSLPFSLSVATGFLVMAACGICAYFLVSGVRGRTHLFDKTRELVFANRGIDWAAWACGALVLLIMAYALGWLWVWMAMGLVGVGFAVAFHAWLDGLVSRQRQPALERAETMLKGLRLRGVDESSLRRFVSEFGGERWEPLFEALFGYEAKLEARAALPPGRGRKKYGAWRDPLVRWIDARVRSQREARDRAHLQKVEQASLQAKGLDAAAARQQAQQVASALVVQAAETRQTADRGAAAGEVDPQVIASQKRARMKAMLADARSGKYARKDRAPWIVQGPLGLLFSGKVRFLLGCLLLVGCVLWVKQNRPVSTSDVRAAAAQAVHQGGVADVARELTSQSWQPLALPVAGPLFDSFNPGVAGVLLMVLALFRGWKMSLFALPAAAVMVLGPKLGLPGIDAIGGAHTTSVVIGLAIAGLGLVLGRTKQE